METAARREVVAWRVLWGMRVFFTVMVIAGSFPLSFGPKGGRPWKVMAAGYVLTILVAIATWCARPGTVEDDLEEGTESGR